MTLQSRVAPDGSLHAHRGRGLFTGNRGVIHDPETKSLSGRRWTTQSWIVCTCEWQGRRREVWGRNGPNGVAGWSELFFLDEVTALAAGHRPCFYCRRERAKAFADAFAKGNNLGQVSASQIDRMLHGERRLSARQAPRRLAPADLTHLPDGAMVETEGDFFAVVGGQLLRWDFGGYGGEIDPTATKGAAITLVTPPATVAALAAGYRPVWHESAVA
ncbi:MAG: hypothetical protein LJE67_07575 [Salaquimonas sp.]|jgi:hypothetical protein|nr:hypothetical protein [Salaquimonas sp.]